MFFRPFQTTSPPLSTTHTPDSVCGRSCVVLSSSPLGSRHGTTRIHGLSSFQMRKMRCGPHDARKQNLEKYLQIILFIGRFAISLGTVKSVSQVVAHVTVMTARDVSLHFPYPLTRPRAPIAEAHSGLKAINAGQNLVQTLTTKACIT